MFENTVHPDDPHANHPETRARRIIQIAALSLKGIHARYAGKIKVPARAHPLVKQLFRLMNEHMTLFVDLGKRAGYSPDTICQWGRPDRIPRVDRLNDVLNALGYELRIVPMEIEDSPEEEEVNTTGLTAGQFRVLSYLKERGEAHSSVQEISLALGYSSKSVEIFFVHLRKAGYVLEKSGAWGDARYRLAAQV